MTDATDTPIPRPRNARLTQALILEAAQATFAAHGFAEVGIRDIAKAADVNQNLITRYFGGKRGLFEQALAATLHLEEMYDTDRETFGANLVTLLRKNDTKTVRSAAMMALSIGDPQAREVGGQQITTRVIEPISKWLDGPHAMARARLVSMLSLGYTVLHLLTIDTGRPAAEDETFMDAWLAHALQGIVDKPDDPAE